MIRGKAGLCRCRVSQPSNMALADRHIACINKNHFLSTSKHHKVKAEFMPKIQFVAAVLMSLPLLACSNSGTVHDGPLEVSRNVELTASGAKQTTVTVTPVKITFPDSRSYSAVPPAFQPDTCTFTSEYFTAEVAVPSTVNLPAYGQNTPPLHVFCQSDQYTFDKSFNRVNLTKQAIAAASVAHVLVGYGLVGAAVTASAGSQRDTSKDTYGYPLKIELQ